MILRHLRHPGPATLPRLLIARCHARPVRVTLRAGLSFDAAVADGLAKAGFSAGYLRLQDLPLAPLAYVIPAPAPGDGRVAWYSDTRVMDAAGGHWPLMIEGGVHLGRQGGAPFCHCHGLWRDPQGGLAAGHLRSDQSVVAQDRDVWGWGLTGATFDLQDDSETGFALFAPRGQARDGASLLCRLRPNEDLGYALLALDLPDGTRIHGIGSLVGSCFADAAPVAGDAAEILIRTGMIEGGIARLQVVSTGMDGTVAQGWLEPGQNPVCVTAELLILPPESSEPDHPADV